MKKNKFKKGISLIVLVITIIVIIILAAAVILTLNNNNPISNANEAVDKWNEKTEEEKNTLALSDMILSLGNQNVSDFVSASNGFTDIATNDYVDYIVGIKDGYGVIADKKDNKILSVTDKSIIKEISQIKSEYEAYKTSGGTVKTTIKQYTADDITTSDEAFKAIVSSYNSEKYKLILIQGNMLCFPYESMTKEKIQVCEANGIYLWGDLTSDTLVNKEDSTYLIDNWPMLENARQKIVADVQYTTDKTINLNDATILRNWVNSNT